MMLGDASDLMAILAWVHPFWEAAEQEAGDEGSPPHLPPVHVYSADFRRSVAELGLDLALSFENVEKQVRKDRSASAPGDNVGSHVDER
ncbi:hypothetical protein F4808DRAFT_440464 [Astrocystis sublimbata]|nr:hypothetical protein F4808DRAFT_440463 [Astrocystis sublimbata]KAI0195526.1 hypothetical protein F4808DRAFT_440464 [Astrocystis sublimbata]